MNVILLDTHVWAWSMMGDRRLSAAAAAHIARADSVAVSAISLYEIGQKATLGKWPEMKPLLASLVEIASRQGVSVLTITPELSLYSATIDWHHRDPFDRIIGATAVRENRTLISADKMFDTFSPLANGPGRLW